MDASQLDVRLWRVGDDEAVYNALRDRLRHRMSEETLCLYA